MRLDQSKFEKWLKSKSSSVIVGHQRVCHDCPLANFHDQASGGWSVVISGNGSGGYRIDRGNGDRRLPRWAARFALLVDGDDSQAITAGRALAILAQVR